MTPIASASRRKAFRAAFILFLCAGLLVPLEGGAHTGKQDTCPSPQAAVDALVAAVKSDDIQAIVHVLGPEGASLRTREIQWQMPPRARSSPRRTTRPTKSNGGRARDADPRQRRVPIPHPAGLP